MNAGKDYKKKIRYFRQRLNLEAAIRAGSIALAVGLSGAVAVLLYGRFAEQELWLLEAAILAIPLFLITALLAWMILLKPGRKEVLERIDALGLQERVITMEELQTEKTVMAEKQRQDTKERLAELPKDCMQIKLYIKPLLWCLGLALLAVVLVLLPFPKQEVDEKAEQNALEMALMDELIVSLREIITVSEAEEEHKNDLHEIVDALAMSLTPEDTTLSRTAKIASASKRLDMLASSEQSEPLTETVQEMKDAMGTSIDVLNKAEGTFWTPEGPSSGTSYDVEPLPTEEQEGEESQEGEEGQEGEQPSEGEEPPEGGEPQEGEGETGEMTGAGTEEIFDPEQGIVSYGVVYEEYYQEILKALTETELSEEIREVIEDYANSLE